MAVVHLPSALASRAEGNREIPGVGSTVEETLRDLIERFPDLSGWMIDEAGSLRQHVSVFVNDTVAELTTPLAETDRVYVVPAISGGVSGDVSGDVDHEATGPSPELLVGTRKGLFTLRRRSGSSKGDGPRFDIVSREFAGEDVDFAIADQRTGVRFAAVSHGQFGPRLFRQEPSGDWDQVDGPAFPDDAGAAITRIWSVVPGEAEGVLWAGVAPAALFKSTDDGKTWSLNRALWNVPGRKDWEGGLGGLCLHSICPWPGDPQRLAVGISAAGVWRTEDGGESWQWGVDGLVPRYIPEEARAETTMFCVHNLHRSPVQPSTLYMQFHGGVYRSDDEGATWDDIAAGLPADFGFPLVADPRNADRAFIIPLSSDMDRVTPDGKVRVYRTDDRGESWQALTAGLPQEGSYLTILRQCFCHDGGDPLGLYFGATSGELFGSVDGGDTWATVAERLPPILSVRVAS